MIPILTFKSTFHLLASKVVPDDLNMAVVEAVDDQNWLYLEYSLSEHLRT